MAQPFISERSPLAAMFQIVVSSVGATLRKTELFVSNGVAESTVGAFLQNMLTNIDLPKGRLELNTLRFLNETRNSFVDTQADAAIRRGFYRARYVVHPVGSRILALADVCHIHQILLRPQPAVNAPFATKTSPTTKEFPANMTMMTVGFLNAGDSSLSHLTVVGVDYHVFCRECARRYVEVGVHEMPLAPNGDGLKCMDPECKRSICAGTHTSDKFTDDAMILAAFNGIANEDIVVALLERSWIENSSQLASFERCGHQG